MVARHYHHLFDGCVLLAAAPRPVRLVVGLDWVQGAWVRRGMEALCAWAQWPVLLRSERLSAGTGAYRPEEGRRYLPRGLREALAVLSSGQALVIFPEGYPVVDPRQSPRRGEELLPFRRGFLVLAKLASRRLGTAVPLLPAGFDYQGRRVRLAFGPPVLVEPSSDESELLQRVEMEVRRLSRPRAESRLASAFP